MLLDSTHQAAKYYSSMNLIATTDYRELADYSIPAVPINADGHGLRDSDVAIAQVVVGLKAEVEKMREQVQNVE